MDARTGTDGGKTPCKKTLTLDVDTVAWGEALAAMDHRGCLSNQIRYLVEQEWKRRGAVLPCPSPAGSEVAA